ncbi:MAG: Membrane-bound metallopeptidase [uncultured Sulfurovum sp.]|uniref:Membrane-bound metallopeptidase n=1 Tax=uncultured Sulfurovum sp. TaxID=269237 RepID=A0A6S6U2N1_9BACT|nr:MAG: Membrane-bound metallopeptidase [uncultured Sulfurovum sp.]
MRFLIVWVLVFTSVLYAESTSSKIKSSKQDLSATNSAKKKASKKLDKIANQIKSAEVDIEKIDANLEHLSEEYAKYEKEYNGLKSELGASEEVLMLTSTEIAKKQELFVSLLSKQFSVILAMEQIGTPTQNSIISYEVYKAYKKHNAQELEVLKKDISGLEKSKQSKVLEQRKLKKSIAVIEKKRDAYTQEKLAKEKTLLKLAKNEEVYEKKLDALVNKQSSLRNTLAKLNILHKKEVKKSRKRAKEKREAIRLEKEHKRKVRKLKALAKKKAREAKEAVKRAKTDKAKKAARLAAKKAKEASRRAQTKVYKKSPKVRKVHSSYKKSKTYAYKGNKTISPLAGAKLIKKFGTYIDPIYKIKIFNESITLKAPSSNAKVKNILNGKVVFAGKSSMLGKVVVVAHSGKMHTVYAGLSKIAPNIQVGSKIKKGYIVGKVASKLMFQATKNSKHINPLKLIKI